MNDREMDIDPVQEQLDAYNARDLERFLACYHDDVIVEDSAGTRLMEGAEALRATYDALFANSPELRADVRSRIRVGDFVIDDERVTGMNLSGLPGEIHAAVIYRLHDGRIAHVRVLM